MHVGHACPGVMQFPLIAHFVPEVTGVLVVATLIAFATAVGTAQVWSCGVVTKGSLDCKVGQLVPLKNHPEQRANGEAAPSSRVPVTHFPGNDVDVHHPQFTPEHSPHERLETHGSEANTSPSIIVATCVGLDARPLQVIVTSNGPASESRNPLIFSEIEVLRIVILDTRSPEGLSVSCALLQKASPEMVIRPNEVYNPSIEGVIAGVSPTVAICVSGESRSRRLATANNGPTSAFESPVMVSMYTDGRLGTDAMLNREIVVTLAVRERGKTTRMTVVSLPRPNPDMASCVVYDTIVWVELCSSGTATIVAIGTTLDEKPNRETRQLSVPANELSSPRIRATIVVGVTETAVPLIGVAPTVDDGSITIVSTDDPNPLPVMVNRVAVESTDGNTGMVI
eukprot:comp21171_c0_seq1/m.44944 comp21171_c0_seq1/g.44944  ORF comp21171_c0_seq1/g.44944 comp21171_c0_seq1/m.44944 type:complete len:397 (+) comp21171_c0_seq1:1444-2634(+)